MIPCLTMNSIKCFIIHENNIFMNDILFGHRQYQILYYFKNYFENNKLSMIFYVVTDSIKHFIIFKIIFKNNISINDILFGHRQYQILYYFQNNFENNILSSDKQYQIIYYFQNSLPKSAF